MGFNSGFKGLTATYTETVGNLAIKSGKSDTSRISVNKNYSLTSICKIKNHEFTDY